MTPVISLATTAPLAAPEQTSDGLICHRFPFDGGNRFLKYFDANGNVVTLQSCIKQLADWEDLEPDQDSVIIENRGARYVVGRLAAEMKGTSTHQGNKAKLASQLLLAALEPRGNQNQILIGTLVVATPDIRDTNAVHALEKLAGTYHFKRNGETITAKINRVEVSEECRAAWKYATNHGGYRWPDAKNAVLDLGGGTALGRIFTRTGSPIRSAEVKLPGTYDLAKRIASALQAKAEYSPDTSLIMDALANGTYRIGQRLHFEGIGQQCRRQWIDEIRGALREAWAAHIEELGEVLVVGGSAVLARDFVESTNGRFKIPNTPSPQHLSLYGMLEG